MPLWSLCTCWYMYRGLLYYYLFLVINAYLPKNTHNDTGLSEIELKTIHTLIDCSYTTLVESKILCEKEVTPLRKKRLICSLVK